MPSVRLNFPHSLDFLHHTALRDRAHMSSDLSILAGLFVSLLQESKPPRASAHSHANILPAAAAFQWVSQTLIVDELPAAMALPDAPFRMRFYDRPPKAAEDFLNYRASVSVGDDIRVAAYASLDAAFDANPLWVPRPAPRSVPRLDPRSDTDAVLIVTSGALRWV